MLFRGLFIASSPKQLFGNPELGINTIFIQDYLACYLVYGSEGVIRV
jgi:hypothetical protein